MIFFVTLSNTRNVFPLFVNAGVLKSLMLESAIAFLNYKYKQV